MKQCSKCKETKTFSEFYKAENIKSGFRSSCKKCMSVYSSIQNKKNRKQKTEYQKKWREKNRKHCNNWQKNWWNKKTREYKKEHYKNDYQRRKIYQIEYRNRKILENPDWDKQQRSKYFQSIRKAQDKWRKNNPEKAREIARKYREKNLERLRERDREWRKKRLEENPRLRIDSNFSSAIRQSLKGKRLDRKWESVVGYTLQDLIQHIEKQFDDKMSWQNYGKYWHIDHCVPQSWFPYQTAEEQAFKDCWDLANLQPLEVFKNKSKGNRFIS